MTKKLRPTDQPQPPELTVRSRRQWVLISYDVVEDRRRTKVMKALEGHGQRVQYSVFECEMRPADLPKLQARLQSLIDPETDDVRFYILCENCQDKVVILGQGKRYQRASFAVI